MAKETRKYSDRAAYLVRAVTKRRKKLKEMAVIEKGGSCQLCGYTRCVTALEFHHINEGDKLFSLSVRGLTRSWSAIQKEIGKCVLVCANCHREIHAGLINLSNETVT